MDEHTIDDILSAHADQINQGRGKAILLEGMSPEQQAALAALMQLAERAQSSLTPVQPSPLFVSELGRQMIWVVTSSSRELNRRTRRMVMWSAAALSSAISLASAAVLLIYLIRHRGKPRAAIPRPSKVSHSTRRTLSIH